MIWTLVCFLITFFVLKKFAFGPIQQVIDERRERIREALDEADNARAPRRTSSLEEHRKMIAQARGRGRRDPRRGAARSPTRSASACARRSRPTASAGSRRRTRQIEAETARALEQIRTEVADLTLIATQKVTGKVLDAADHKRLIEEAIGELDFSALEGSPN